MVRNAKDLEAKFKLVGVARQGNPEFANDDGYWTGRKCNWGGYHSLSEDCRTLASGLNKTESLNGKAITETLTKCTNKQEFESNKSTLLRKADEVLSQLKIRTGYSSSMFGICCIWGQEGMNDYVESKMQECRRKLEDLKNQLNQNQYQHIEQLRLLQLEQKKIEARMKQRQREAQREKDPSKKAALLLLIENDAKELEENLRQQQAIPKSGINFNPKEYVDKIINGIRDVLRNKGKGGSGGGGNPNKPNRPNKPNDNPFDFPTGGNSGNNDPNDNTNPRTPRGRSSDKKDKDNSQMIIFAIVALIVLFFLMNQKEARPSRYDDLDYYY